MTGTAVVVYVSPKIASNFTVWCLEPLGGVPLIRRLCERLRKGFASDDFEYLIAFHDEVLPARLEEALKDLPVKIFPSKALDRLQVLADLCRANPELKTILVFPENAVFPDCRTSRLLLQMHRGRKAEGSASPECPPGLLPEVYETKALLRLAGLGLPADVGSECYDVMKKANELFTGDPDMNFTLFAFNPQLWAADLPLEGLPSDMRVDSRSSLAAAENVLVQNPEADDGGSVLARLFKEELLKLEARREFHFKDRRESGNQIPILYHTVYGAFSGAEESFSQLILNLDRRRFHPVALLKHEGILSQKLRAAGVQVEIPSCDLSKTTPFTLAYCKALLSDLGIRLVHINAEGALPLLVSASALGLPIVHHVRAFLGRGATDNMKFASRIITVSEAVAKDLRRSDVEQERIVAIHNGMDLERFKPGRYAKSEVRAQAGLRPNQKVAALIARITPQKNQELFLAAWPAVIKRFPDSVALLVGETYPKDVPYAGRLRATVTEEGLDKKVRFWGFEPEIGRIHGMADAVVLCTDNEPFGRSMIEALAMGVPVVLPGRGGHLEVIRHGENGLLYNAGDSAALAKELIRLFSEPGLAERLATNGLQTARQLDIQTHVQKVCQIYSELLTLK